MKMGEPDAARWHDCDRADAGIYSDGHEDHFAAPLRVGVKYQEKVEHYDESAVHQPNCGKEYINNSR